MRKLLFPYATFLVLCLLGQAVPVDGAERERVALVIGNANYENQPKLTNTLNDARDMAVKLQDLGFRVTREQNLKRRRFAQILNDFVRRMRGTDAVALFYYSGHGLQVLGKNYLVPVDAQIQDELDVPTEGLAVDYVLNNMGNRPEQAVNLVILDACRDNPFKRPNRKSIGDKGLAKVSAPSGTLILYATRPGDTASDNPQGDNGLFTKHLLKALDKPALQVEVAFKEAAQEVFRESRKTQHPWLEGLLLGKFYFRPPEKSRPQMTALPRFPMGPTENTVANQMELLFWQSIHDSTNPAHYEAYLAQYRDGRYATLARLRVDELTKQSPLPIPAAPLLQTSKSAPANPLKTQLTVCHTHVNAKRLTTPTGRNAFDCYQAILAKAPENREALEGLEKIVSRYLSWAEHDLKRGRLKQAKTYIDRAKRVNSDHPRLDVLVEKLRLAKTEASQRAKEDRLYQASLEPNLGKEISTAKHEPQPKMPPALSQQPEPNVPPDPSKPQPSGASIQIIRVNGTELTGLNATTVTSALSKARQGGARAVILEFVHPITYATEAGLKALESGVHIFGPDNFLLVNLSISPQESKDIKIADHLRLFSSVDSAVAALRR